MGHVLVGGDEFRTRFADMPSINIYATPDGPLDLELAYPTQPAPAGTQARFARVRFVEVFEYRWIAAGQTYSVTNRDDYEFNLIRIIDSGQIEQLLREGMYGDRPRGQRLGARSMKLAFGITASDSTNTEPST